MKIYAERDNYKCALLEPDDWKIYKAIYLDEVNLFCSKHQLIADSKLPETYWRKELSDQKEKHFCLLTSKNIEIGHVGLRLDLSAPTFSNSYLTPNLRGQNLSDLLYQACFLYAAQQTQARFIECSIAENNLPSIASAIRNGFKLNGKSFGTQPRYNTYERSLDLYRPQAQRCLDLDSPTP